MSLPKFKNINDLAKWITNNVEHIPQGQDDQFIPYEDIFTYRKANCIDLALLYYKYLKMYRIRCKIFQIGLLYEEDFYQRGQYHICCVYFYNNTWIVVQNLLIGDIKEEVFICNSNKILIALVNFAKLFLPAYKKLTGLTKSEEVIRTLRVRDVRKLNLYIACDDLDHKQKRFSKLANQRQNIFYLPRIRDLYNSK